MKDLTKYVSAQLRTANTFPALLTAAHLAIDLTERATRSLTSEATESSYSSCAAAEAEAITASEVFAAAPALCPPDAELATHERHQAFSTATAMLALATARALVAAAERTTHEGDRITCLEAAMHIEHVHSALR